MEERSRFADILKHTLWCDRVFAIYHTTPDESPSSCGSCEDFVLTGDLIGDHKIEFLAPSRNGLCYNQRGQKTSCSGVLSQPEIPDNEEFDKNTRLRVTSSREIRPMEFKLSLSKSFH